MNQKKEDEKKEWNDFPEIQGKYVILEKVGSGTFSDVYHAISISNTSQHVALKRIKRTVHPSKIKSEIEILQKLNGKENTSKLIEGLRYKDQITLVLEYLPHNTLRAMGINSIRNYMKALLQSLSYLHSFGIIHRDVKPGNFLMNPIEGKYLLVDFGLAEFEKKKEVLHLEKIETVNIKNKQEIPHVSRAGTRGFRAPEILIRYPHQTIAIDMWSAGVILLSLLTYRYPFFQSHDDMFALTEIMCLIPFKEIEEKFLKAYNQKISCSKDVLDRVGQFNPEKNWRSFCEKCNLGCGFGTFPDSVFDLLDKLLDVDHNTRIKAKDALKHPFFTEN